jgi:hypothetical protein
MYAPQRGILMMRRPARTVSIIRIERRNQNRITEEQMIAAAPESEQKLIKAYFEYIKAKHKYQAMLEAYTKGEPVYTPSIEVIFPDDRKESDGQCE